MMMMKKFGFWYWLQSTDSSAKNRFCRRHNLCFLQYFMYISFWAKLDSFFLSLRPVEVIAAETYCMGCIAFWQIETKQNFVPLHPP